MPVRLQHVGRFNYALLYCRGFCSDLYLFKELMKKIHLKQAVISLATVFTLFVSAISACACSHHQPQTKAEQPSCHPAPHGVTADLGSPAHSESLTPGCNCLVRTPVPAITAKSEKKKAAADKLICALAQGVVLPELPTLVLASIDRGFQPVDLILPGKPLTSRPSRAPPRL